MKPRTKRFAIIGGAVAVLGIAAALVLNAFNSNMVFFFTPTQVAAGEAPKGRTYRIGGMVKMGSIKKLPDGLTVEFVVTDNAKDMNVTYKGFLPDLFREGKGVVAQGKTEKEGMFVASEILAKHDENYMPPEAQHAMDAAKAAKAAQTVKQ